MVYRIEAATRGSAAQAFSGEGGMHVAGRWNFQGSRIVYTSGSLALAALEKLVHLSGFSLHGTHVFFEAEFPDEWVGEIPRLPKGWDSFPAGAPSMARGDKWLKDGPSPVLRVPSAIIPREFNFLLNPARIDRQRLKINGPHPFNFDGRLTARR